MLNNQKYPKNTVDWFFSLSINLSKLLLSFVHETTNTHLLHTINKMVPIQKLKKNNDFNFFLLIDLFQVKNLLQVCSNLSCL